MPSRLSLSTVSPASFDDCRRAVLAGMQNAASELNAPTASAEVVSSAINDGVSAIAPGGLNAGSPDSFLLDSTDTDATPTRKAKEERDKIDNAPLIVLFASAPQSQKEIGIFFDEPGARSEKECAKKKNEKSQAVVQAKTNTPTQNHRPFALQLQENLPLRHALENVAKSNAQLLWVHAYSRRSEDMSCFSSSLVAKFKIWISRKPGVTAFVDLHSLLIDRNIAPFFPLARRLSRPAQEKNVTLESQASEIECGRNWVPLDIYVTPGISTNKVDAQDGSQRCANERVLRTEISGLFPKDQAPKQYFAYCSSLLHVPEPGSILFKLGAFDSPAGLARPRSEGSITSDAGEKEDNASVTPGQWVSAFSGLMISLSHTKALLVVRIYTSDPEASSQHEPFKAILVQPLTPLSAIVRSVDPTILRELKLDLLDANHPSIVSMASSKRIFPDPCARNGHCVDSVGEPMESLNARFFESHLSNTSLTTELDEDENSNDIQETLRSSGTSQSPHNISSLLENFSGLPNSKLIQKIGSSLEKFEDGMNDARHCTEYSQGELGCDKAIMEKLRASLAVRKTPNVQWGENGLVVASRSAESLSSSPAKRIETEVGADNITKITSSRGLQNPDNGCSLTEVQVSDQKTETRSIPCTPLVEGVGYPTLQAASLLLSIGRSTSPCPLEQIPPSTIFPVIDKTDDLVRSPATFASISGQIEDEILALKSIDMDDLVMQCNVVLRSFGRMVHLGNQTAFSFVKEESFKNRIVKFSKIQKNIRSKEKAKSNSSNTEKLDRDLLISCLRAYEQAMLRAFKEVVAFDVHIKEIKYDDGIFSDKTERILERGLKRTSKLLNIVQVLSVAQDLHNNDGNPYGEIFDNFFTSVLSNFGAGDCHLAARAVAKALADEYEKPLELPELSSVPFVSEPGEALEGYSVGGTRSRAEFSSQDISQVPAPAPKRTRPRDHGRSEGGPRKRPRTKDLKRVLADATASRLQQAVPRRESSRLTHEKCIQRPLQSRTKGSTSSKRRSTLRSSDPLYGSHLASKRKESFAEMMKPQLEECIDEDYVLPLKFYPKDHMGSQPDSVGTNYNEVCVPETPENEL